jgi:multidrug efflux pump subunit AcrA (membrane-fusion protein)
VRRPTIWTKYCFPLAVLALTACTKQAPPQAAPQAMPVQTATVAAAPVPQYDEYVSTIKSRRSATIQPQVDGNLTKIYVHSGDHVHSGQVLMEIDPAKQEATVASTKATEQQKLAVFQYNQIEVERQRKLFEQGVTSRDLPRARESNWAITTLRRPLKVSWAMFQCIWATMFLLPRC